jgi:3-hydroxyisobutyrate dehydrogenase-like beta-hydroxyacid dehydrogenase
MFMHQAQCTFCCLFDDENINTQALQLKGHGLLNKINPNKMLISMKTFSLLYFFKL